MGKPNITVNGPAQIGDHNTQHNTTINPAAATYSQRSEWLQGMRDPEDGSNSLRKWRRGESNPRPKVHPRARLRV
jgi:hypothetical protein